MIAPRTSAEILAEAETWVALLGVLDLELDAPSSILGFVHSINVSGWDVLAEFRFRRIGAPRASPG